MIYEAGNYKSTLTNTNNPMLATCIAVPDYKAFFLIYNLTKKSIKSVLTNEDIVDFTNVFDSQDFLQSSSHETGSGIQSMNFNYIKI